MSQETTAYAVSARSLSAANRPDPAEFRRFAHRRYRTPTVRRVGGGAERTRTLDFNTTTSMGRLTLNMLLSFAQFEREVTGERIRDPIFGPLMVRFKQARQAGYRPAGSAAQGD